MKQLHLIILLGLLSLTSSLQAQEQTEPGEQLLVFRNTGVVDLLYTNEVDSILTNDTTQVFYAKDTTLVVPIAELDSVAVGNRNVIAYKSSTKVITEDSEWIIRYDGENVYYKPNTPSAILPKVGDRLFYGKQDELFPIGLVCKVNAIDFVNNEYKVNVSDVELNEVFDQLFYAGPAKDVPAANSRRVPIYNDKLTCEIPLTIIGPNSSFEMSDEFGLDMNVVVHPLRGYYHIDCELSNELIAKLKVNLVKKDTCAFHKRLLDVPLGVYALVFTPTLHVDAFCQIKAELNASFQHTRSQKVRLDWTRERGKEDVFNITNLSESGEHADVKNQVDITLDGELFAGVGATFDLNFLRETAGARATVNAGPAIKGELSVGALAQGRNYLPDFYAKGDITLTLKLEGVGSVYFRNLLDGEEHETELMKREIDLFPQTLHLFPPYTHSNAVVCQSANGANDISTTTTEVATAVEELTQTDIETGFEIVDELGEVVDSIFVGTIEAEPEDTTVVQTFDTEISLPSTIKQEDLQGYTMRPIFHYAGYTISAAPVGIMKDVLLQSYSATQTNGAVTFIGNSPFLGSAMKDSTLYQVGLYLPVPLKNNVYQQGKDRKIITGTPIDDWHSSLLIGTWTGKVNGEDVTLTFNEDETGVFNNVAFVYELNNPQSGDLELRFDNGETMILRLLSVTEGELKLMDKRDESQTVWTLTNR